MNKELHVAAETGGPSPDQSPRNTQLGSANYLGMTNPPLGTIESARDIVQTIALALKRGYQPDEILGVGSPILERVWAEATALRAATGATS
jgi:hypothetical protein